MLSCQLGTLVVVSSGCLPPFNVSPSLPKPVWVYTEIAHDMPAGAFTIHCLPSWTPNAGAPSPVSVVGFMGASEQSLPSFLNEKQRVSPPTLVAGRLSDLTTGCSTGEEGNCQREHCFVEKLSWSHFLISFLMLHSRREFALATDLLLVK